MKPVLCSIKSVIITLTILCLLTFSSAATIMAQTSEETSLQEAKQKASELMKQQKYADALPILEKIAATEPNNPQTHFYLGFALIAQTNILHDPAARKVMRLRARNEFIKAKELGNQEPLVDAMIQSIPADGSESGAFSQNPEANRLMGEAESLFSQGKLEEALKNYQKALQLDEKLYEAALFSGDVYTQRGDFPLAEVWYQRAIAIDPNREIAYRYSATPFMRQGKYDQARDRYIESYISEPYSKFAITGISQWAQATHTNLSHPQIEIPASITFDEKGDSKINLDQNAIHHDKDDGTMAWVTYGATRVIWHKEKFAKTYPQEKTYRHSLAEEADALRSVIQLATSDKKTKTLNPSLAKLKKLNDEGLLEAYILLARADQGIVYDYPAYLRQNRDKLRRYVTTYILTNGGGNQ